MALITPNGKSGFVGIFTLAALIFIFSFSVFGQQTACSISSGSPAVHSEGLSEQIGDITLTCSGGTATINTLLFVGTNAPITNRLDANGNLTNITITGAGVSSQAPPTLNSPTTLLFASVNLPGAAATFTISGIRVAVAGISNGGSTPLITGTVAATQLNIPQNPLVLALAAPTLLTSVLNYGIPCVGSPTPTTVDFPGLVAAGATSSTVRVTEASPTAFTAKNGNADSGVRIVVKLSGYSSNAQVYVPDAIVGNKSTNPTSAGSFNSSPNGGTYSPGLNLLLLTRVSGADANGAGGSRLLPLAPGTTTSFTSVSQLSLTNGEATVTYEVLDANPNVIDSAHIPVFVVAPPSNCAVLPPANTLGASVGPISSVSTPTQADPIPRFIATTPGLDCSVFGDCTQTYFPVLQVTPASITLTGSSRGQTQTSFISVGDGGASQLTFTAKIAYQRTPSQSSANWLSLNVTTGVVNPIAGIGSLGLNVSASPTDLLVSDTYQATITIDAGSAGLTVVPVTFIVGPAGPVIQSVVNAANSQAGPVTAGSFVAIYGLNLVKKNSATVTFNGFPATISYDGQPTASGPSQINALVPNGLGLASTAGVVATIDGIPSNTFAVSLVQNAPAVFNPGILNQNNSVNLPASPESRGNIIQVFLTGLATPVAVPVSVGIGGQVLTGGQIIYAGPVPSIPGLEQINVQVPSALSFSGNSAPLTVCVPGPAGQAVCSAPINLYLQ
jgi:uncharacterized protein (TIGR03437 family)